MTTLATRLGMTAAVLATGLLAGCRYDGTGTKMQWAPDMADSPAPKAQRDYLDPPEGSVAMNSILYVKTPEEAEQVYGMPEMIANDPQGMEKGKKHFETFCQPCHGANAKGGKLPGIVPPDLTHESYQGRKDGFFFYRITFGANVMPGYGYATTPAERWYIIRHLRLLQKGA